MNIVVVGGGTPNKFGNDFVKRANQESHTVKVLSHRLSKDSNCVINFSSLDDVVNKFNSVVSGIETLDILLYNTSIDAYPNSMKDFTSKSTIKEKLYHYGFSIHVVIPHALSVAALSKMNSSSKIVFMTTDMIYDKQRNKYIDRLGYSGGKSYLHQLMLALAEYNDVSATVSSVSPFFNYEDKKHYSTVFEKAYSHILSHGREFNGQVFDCWE